MGSLQQRVLRSWSLVKMGTTANQKKLFFNLHKVTLPRIISAYKVSQPTVRRRRVQSRSAPERDDAGQGDG